MATQEPQDLAERPSTAVVSYSQSRHRFIDGLRGLTALYVVLFHACYFAMTLPLNTFGTFIICLLRYGHFAVCVFIVLSGFCLMIPLSSANLTSLTHSYSNYIKRRIRRILPPYYAALAFSTVILFVEQYLRTIPSPGRNLLKDVLDSYALIPHLLLIHNLNFDWVYRINGPLWSIATEFQIYLLFPLLLLPLMKRYGRIPLIFIAICIGLVPQYTLPAGQNFWWACPWFLGLFAMGMCVADIHYNTRIPSQHWHTIIAAWPTPIILFILVIIPPFPYGTPIWIYDVLVGIGTMALIAFCLQKHRFYLDNQRLPLIVRLLTSSFLVRLGSFSYSIYLIHDPLIKVLQRSLQPHIASPELLMFYTITFSLGIILPLAYLFHRIFELPLLNYPVTAITKSVSAKSV